MSEPALRFVVLRHDGIDDPHFDVMIEAAPGSSLTTWRSTSWPPKVNERAKKIGEHRKEYLEYQGAVSGRRGNVKRVESGTFTKSAAKFGIEVYQLNGASIDRVMMRQVSADEWVMWVP
jgi:hypothetical protein